MWNSKLWKGYHLSISYSKGVPFLPKMVYKRLRGCTLWQSLPVKLCWVHPPPFQDPNHSLQVLRVFNFCQVMKKYIMAIYHSQYVMFLFFWEADLSMWFVKVLVLIFLKSFSVKFVAERWSKPQGRGQRYSQNLLRIKGINDYLGILSKIQVKIKLTLFMDKNFSKKSQI